MRRFLLRVGVGVGLLYVPLLAFAQSFERGKGSVQGYIILILQFINYTLLPLLFSFALLFFLFNAARYFIFEASDQDARDNAKKLALYGISAFVLMVSIWGIVNMFVFGLQIDAQGAICPDYLKNWCNPGGPPSNFNLFDNNSDYNYYGPGSDDYFYE
jgi:hypothetical protein